MEEPEVEMVPAKASVNVGAIAGGLRKPACEDCRFWAQSRHDGAPPGVGQCRRRAPLMSSPPSIVVDRWPATSRSAWCGEFEP